ncbi:Vacuolar protein sorting-associated protein 9A [Acorus calamus]|uniref:Vacuolar protein sorting-associated protein 9A n=1 Tax=Acorus calamus TaxID=4465 RepID=A0AAV9EIA8_ACOCL|nr:Vacuolar protein sorting-associated protein 9A [Acorus calamus]
MENADPFVASTAPLTWHDFLERMRHPSAADFVKSIKSFIVSFSNRVPDPERDSTSVQEFLASMEGAFRAHSLFTGCTEEELESAGEGLEKYVMTKLFNCAFASLPEEVKRDEELSEKMSLLQQFIRPESLDIKPTFQNETSWLANPPQLHSNLLYIQRYRGQSRLVSEAAYFFTNLLSAESFIWNVDAKSLSMDEEEFKNNMDSAQALLSGLERHIGQGNQDRSHPSIEESKSLNKGEKDHSLTKTTSILDLEKKGTTDLLKEDELNTYFQEYPFLYASSGDLTVDDVESLLNSYKQLVLKYVCLSKGMGHNSPSVFESSAKTESQTDTNEKLLDGANDDKGENRTIEESSSFSSLIGMDNIDASVRHPCPESDET